MPSGLFPSLQGARLHGSFAGLGSLVVDTAAPDDLELRFDVADGCRFITVPAALDADRFRHPFRHRAHHPDGSTFERETGPGTPTWTPFTALSPYLVVAVITTEDGGFYQHHGVSHRAVRDALAANLRAGRFVRGASTITMQLAKNLFLGREKTLSRKLEELALTAYLEQAFSKNELLELYFNVIEFGPDVYGIAEAAEHYFGRTPNELNLVESMFLSTLLPSPLRLHAMRDRGAVTPRWRKQVDALLRIAHKRGLVTAGELSEALAAPLDLHTDDAPPPQPRPPAAPHRRVPDTFDDWEELPGEGP
jgi:membrane peptidoglycan carboxypeptidase